VLLRHTQEVDALCMPCATLVGLLVGHRGCIGIAAGVLCGGAAWSDTAGRVRDAGPNRLHVVC